ncbi:MAG: MerR family transcriptional regulator [bacterium]|nr:MerR family transcriptional regulator [bacterium]
MTSKKPNYPSKLYYSISEVANIIGVKAHVLRYWETEFSTLRPKKTRTGSRRYRQADIEEILAIKELLYEDGFKIAGAQKMRRQARQKSKEIQAEVIPQMDLGFGKADDSQKMETIKSELQDILQMLRKLGDELNQDSSKPSAEKPLKKMEGKG